jgi:hypothetical protein
MSVHFLATSIPFTFVYFPINSFSFSLVLSFPFSPSSLYFYKDVKRPASINQAAFDFFRVQLKEACKVYRVLLHFLLQFKKVKRQLITEVNSEGS